MTIFRASDQAPYPHRACRRWTLTGTATPDRPRLHAAGAPAPRPGERVRVVELGSWPAVWVAVRHAIAPTVAITQEDTHA